VEFEEFLTVNLDRLTRYAGVLTGDRPLAEDVLAQTLITVWQKWNRIRSMDFPLAYVRSAVTRTYLDHCRREGRRRTFATSSPTTLDVSLSAVTGQVDDRSELDELLSALPARQRAVLVMRFYLDLPDKSIAAALGCSVPTVRSSAFRGLAAVRARADSMKD